MTGAMKCEGLHGAQPRAFSAEVDAGSASKMRPPHFSIGAFAPTVHRNGSASKMRPQPDKQTGERSPAPPIQATFWDQNVMLVPMPISSEL